MIRGYLDRPLEKWNLLFEQSPFKQGVHRGWRADVPKHEVGVDLRRLLRLLLVREELGLSQLRVVDEVHFAVWSVRGGDEVVESRDLVVRRRLGLVVKDRGCER